MSKLKLEGNASGTGTFTIAAPNSNTDRALALPDEAGTVLTSASDLAAANLTGTVAAARLPAGSVLQVLQTVKTTEFSTTSASYVTTGLSVSITPSSTSNKVLVIFSGATSGSAEGVFAGSQLKRASTVISTKDQPVHRSWEGSSSFCYLDSPSTTSSTTYEIFIKANAGTAYLNRDGNDDSTITVMEIAG